VAPTVAGAATLLLKAKPGVNQAQFKWGKGPAVPLTDFGTPPSEVTRVCVYDQTGPTSYVLAQSGSPSVSSGTWSARPRGWTFKSKTGAPDGITGVTLTASATPLRARVQVLAKGNPALGLPLHQTPAVVAQFKTAAGKCWGATFSTAIENTAAEFKAKSN
jgi:hypothetical protein